MKTLTVVGVPSGAGACGVGQDRAPSALRAAGLIDHLAAVGFDVTDLGDSPAVPWRPDRTRPRAQNLDAVVNVVQTTAKRVADILEGPGRRVLVLGGDCTVGIGTIAGVQAAIGKVGIVYFDLHSDLNTPATARDGALDWMGLAHMLGLEGTEPALAAAIGKPPMLVPAQVVLFAHSRSDSTRFEREQIERLDLASITVDDVRNEPQAAAHKALQLLADQADHYLLHLDVDVIDFTDAPLSEHSSRNTGVTLDTMLAALKVLASGPGLTAITLTELNPHNAAAADGLLERFAARFANALGPTTR
jgi:arginase